MIIVYDSMQPERDMVIHNPAHRQLVGTLCMQLYHCMQVSVSVVQFGGCPLFRGYDCIIYNRFQLVHIEVSVIESIH